MVEKQLLIVGIDPGTTMGYSALNLKGKVIKQFSSKDMGIDSFIKQIISIGNPIIIGCDKANPPTFVLKAAVRLGARLFTPSTDVSVKLKEQLAGKSKNDHERDSLASAILAFKRFRTLLKKIDIFIKRNNKERLRHDLTQLVINKEISIADAMDFLEQPVEEKIIQEKLTLERQLSKKDFETLLSSIAKLRKENLLLKSYNSKLKKVITKQKKKGLKIKLPRFTESEKLKFKEETIHVLDKKLKDSENTISSLKKKVMNNELLLSDIKGKVIVKKLDDFSIKELKLKEDMFRINEGDVLLVKHPELIGEKALSKLRGKVAIIITRQKLTKKLKDKLPFIVVDCSKLSIKELDNLAIINKTDLEAAVSAKTLLTKIVTDYKESRN